MIKFPLILLFFIVIFCHEFFWAKAPLCNEMAQKRSVFGNRILLNIDVGVLTHI